MLKAQILLTDEIPAPPALVRLGIETLPATIGARNERTRLRFIQFFTANIRNRNTRCAYARAVKQFFDWTEGRRLELEEIDALAVAAYIEKIGGEMAPLCAKFKASRGGPLTFNAETANRADRGADAAAGARPRRARYAARNHPRSRRTRPAAASLNFSPPTFVTATRALPMRAR
jgi:hypothetical protein